MTDLDALYAAAHDTAPGWTAERRDARDRAAYALVEAVPGLRAEIDALRAERDRLAVALAEMREAASQYASATDMGGGTPLARALAATPADLAAAHDRRVRAEALRDAADAIEHVSGQRGVRDWLRARAKEVERG